MNFYPLSLKASLPVKLISLIFFLSIPLLIFSEGTAQWMALTKLAGQEMALSLFNTTDGNDRLGTTGCNADERINIAVSTDFANEVIYIGMNKYSSTASFFRVMDPTGVQVYPVLPSPLQAVLSSGTGNTGEGYIADLTEARNGPEEVFGAGGYDAISITPAMAGNYYIEFNGDNSTTFNKPARHQISLFDVTVANTNGLAEGLGNHTAIDGRLNSFQWAFYNKLQGTGFNTNGINAQYFLYQSDDSLVLAVQWDSVKAGGWDMAFTRNGVQTTGDYFTDRQSQEYTTVGKGSVDGEFPIFFNDPDPDIYPSAGELPQLTFLEYDRCSGSTCFLYNITKGGQVRILIDLNENGVFDPNTSDRLLVDNKPAGTHCLAWDDLDGLGNLIVQGQAQAVIKYQAGIFHMPLGDVEANPNGFDRTLVRPLFFLDETDPGRIYYDHTEVGGFGSTDFDYFGVLTDGNIWFADDGDQNYLNTWFSFSEISDTLIVTFNTCDKDDDGLSDVLDIDDDNDGIPDIVEMYNGDHDDDGTPDYEDADFCTATFQGVNGWDCADGLPDPSDDLDGDGIRNALDSDFPGCGSTINGACSNYDSDSDGIPDYLDRDSDNDGISDLIEIGGVDIDGDGVIDDLTDTDGDGLADDYDNDDTDGPNGSSPCADQAGCLQGVSTNPLLDTDNDGSTDNARDTDGDGLGDWIDLDSDNDGIPDVVEVGATDSDGDGFADNYVDVDNDGFNDIVDGQICTDSTAIDTATYIDGSSTGVDDGTEANGQPDGDVAELYTLGDQIVLDFGVSLPIGTQYVIYWKRKDYNDDSFTSDMVVEESLSPGSGYSTHTVSPSTNSEEAIVTTVLEVELVNTRYIKLSLVSDSNDDFEVDAVKYFYNEETCVAGNPILITGADGNSDGIPDSYPSDDTDDDGVLDHLDLDSDNDGIPDVVEAGGTDTNGDGIFDDQTDSDNDGFADDVDGDVGNNGVAENSGDALQLTGADTDDNGVPNSYPNDDTDGDGIRDQLDLDADNDGIPDVVEAGGTDVNGDGRADSYADADSDGFNDVLDGDVGNDGTAENSSDALTLTGADGDNNGAPDTYPNDDNDGDGILNAIDLDSDNDGIPDVVEAGGTDENGDGRADNYSDSDNDGFNNDVDGDPNNSLTLGDDSNDTNTGNALQLTNADGDNDGTPDSYPEGDTDGDGILDQLDLDADNDGIPDVVEAGGTDVNGDGRTDNYTDLDNDGFNDDVDGDPNNSLAVGDDSDDTNTSNALLLTDEDANNDGVPDSYPNDDNDGDGILNHLDLDADNDGIPDVVEAGGTDENGDGRADDYADADGDGFNDAVDGDPTNVLAVGTDTDGANSNDALLKTGTDGDSDGEPDTYPNDDNDGDGILNYLDLDADNDGIPDVVEVGGTDENGDGRADNYTDADGDGFNDDVDGDPNNSLVVGDDSNDTNTANALVATDEDDDLDGVPDSRPNGDLDQDGHYNFLDLDADSDGILDVLEAGGADTNEDGIEDAFADADTDGFNDNVDGDSNNSLAAGDDTVEADALNATTLTSTDSDNDGAPDSYPNDDFDTDGRLDQLDIDADNDGIVDNTEAQTTAGYVAPSSADTDEDGIDDIYDGNVGTFGGAGSGLTPTDTDVADDPGSPDYLDLNSDDDFYSDAVEGHDSNGDGIADSGSPANTGFSGGTTDVDGDGLYDGWDNNTASTDATNGLLQGTSHPNVGNSATAERDWREIQDKDNDGIADEIDVDKDNDGILDRDECLTTTANSIVGGDGGSTTNFSQDDVTSAYFDILSIDNSFEILINGGNLNANNIFQIEGAHFGAGQIMMEFSSDGSEISQPWVVSSNGLPRLRVFIDANGQISILGTRATGSTSLELMQPRDGSSFNTITFIGGSNTFSVINQDAGGPDAINATAYVFSSCDTDGDGNPDYCDLDSDNDGIADVIEAGGTDANNDGVIDGFTDTDNDGFADGLDPNRGGTALADLDQDGDGFANRIDLDSDDDGIADIIEAGGVDTNGDGKGDTSTDTDADGWFNTFDSDNSGSVLSTPNTDGDAFADYLDLDSDSDGIIDNVEGQTTAAFEPPSGIDFDNDGWDDEYDGDVTGAANGTPIVLSNNESNGNPDYTDNDSDGDGFPDWIEGFDDDEDGDALDDLITRADNYETAASNPLDYVTSDDADADGIPDFLEDSDGDNTPNFLDPDNGTFYLDSDNDGLVNLYDTDTSGIASILPNGDADAEPDFRDTDNEISLPIELISFTATKFGNEVMLNWETATEINNNYFIVERSTDGKSFEQILTKNGSGNSTTEVAYSDADKSPKGGNNYYRLTQVDFDGKSEVFDEMIKVVNFASTSFGVIKLYPNPTNGEELFLEIQNSKSAKVELEILSPIGKLIKAKRYTMDSEGSTIKLELLKELSLSKGVYYLKLVDGLKVESFKFVVQ